MYFEGYLKILGIEASAYVNFTMQAMEMYVYGRVWNLIYAELYVSASYDYTSIKDAHFYIRVIVDLRGLTDVSSWDPFWKNSKISNSKIIPGKLSRKNFVVSFILKMQGQEIQRCIYDPDKHPWYRSSHPEVFLRKDVLKICSKFTIEHLCRSVISIKLRSNFIEVALRYGCSLVNLLHILRTPFLRTPLDGYYCMIELFMKLVNGYTPVLESLFHGCLTSS